MRREEAIETLDTVCNFAVPVHPYYYYGVYITQYHIVVLLTSAVSPVSFLILHLRAVSRGCCGLFTILPVFTICCFCILSTHNDHRPPLLLRELCSTASLGLHSATSRYEYLSKVRNSDVLVRTCLLRTLVPGVRICKQVLRYHRYECCCTEDADSSSNAIAMECA